jgi:ATP diphosphatase
MTRFEGPEASPAASGLARLEALMARLRDPVGGCEWDRAQDFATIAPYTLEEAYEVADAIERTDMEALKDELGDLQFQIVFHARMAQEIGAFALSDVMEAITAKMERRHPHIFGQAPVAPDWEALKAEERMKASDSSALAGVAIALPALRRAEKIQQRAARVGFDWPDPSGAVAKIHEELEEIEDASTSEERAGEVGDLLFAVVNYARHLGIDPETALRGATSRFERRFRKMEETSAKPLRDLDLDDLESLWQRAKRET